VPSLRLTEVARATGGTIVGGLSGPDGHGGSCCRTELELAGVSTDTRRIARGSLFVALRGERFDGHDFLAEAARSGARAALVDRPIAADRGHGLLQVRVADTRRALGELARFHALRCGARRAAITGSNGKTTTKELLRAAFAAAGPTVASEKSFNNEIGLPLTLLTIEADTRYAVLEMGTNRPGEIARLAELGRPELAILTNCAPAHVEFLHDLAGVVREKGALIEALPADGVAVLNADDPALPTLRARTRARVVTFGVRRPADFRAVDIRFDLSRLVYRLRGQRVFVPLGGCHNVYNSLAALAAAEAFGMPLADAIDALREAEGPPMRLVPMEVGGITLLDDTYNANPGSVEAAFRTLAAAPLKGRRVVVLGDMLELGVHAAELHCRAGELVSLLSDVLLVAAGQHAADVARGAASRGADPSRVVTCANAQAAAAIVPALIEAGDTVLVKGSRGMAMEQVVAAIQGRFGARVAAAGATRAAG
jgi:UDP-N-acetylmuramoyl-tripeptide--D-alanyl-D-alanine ligase